MHTSRVCARNIQHLRNSYPSIRSPTQCRIGLVAQVVVEQHHTAFRLPCHKDDLPCVTRHREGLKEHNRNHHHLLHICGSCLGLTAGWVLARMLPIGRCSWWPNQGVPMVMINNCAMRRNHHPKTTQRDPPILDATIYIVSGGVW